MHWVSSNFFLNRAGRFAQFATDQREINLVNRSCSELRRQRSMGIIGPGYDQASGRVLVQPMHNSRPFFAADSGKPWKMKQERVDESVFVLSRPRMNDQPGGPIDHDQVFVFI